VEQGLYAAYAKGRDVRDLIAIVGKEALSDADKKFLEFADVFENKFIRQGRDENRTLEQTLELGWELIGMVPESALTMIDRKTLEKYHPSYRKKKKE
jgi:V/A-type H+-transporting ATPase subunit B